MIFVLLWCFFWQWWSREENSFCYCYLSSRKKERRKNEKSNKEIRFEIFFVWWSNTFEHHKPNKKRSYLYLNRKKIEKTEKKNDKDDKQVNAWLIFTIFFSFYKNFIHRSATMDGWIIIIVSHIDDVCALASVNIFFVFHFDLIILIILIFKS